MCVSHSSKLNGSNCSLNFKTFIAFNVSFPVVFDYKFQILLIACKFKCVPHLFCTSGILYFVVFGCFQLCYF